MHYCNHYLKDDDANNVSFTKSVKTKSGSKKGTLESLLDKGFDADALLTKIKQDQPEFEFIFRMIVKELNLGHLAADKQKRLQNLTVEGFSLHLLVFDAQ